MLADHNFQQACTAKRKTRLTSPLVDSGVKMNERDYYLKKARQSNKKFDWFRRTWNNRTYSMRQAKATYCRNLLQENSHQPKDFWNSTKKVFSIYIKAKPNSLPTMMNVDGTKVFDKHLIATCSEKSSSPSDSSSKTRSRSLVIASRKCIPTQTPNV